MRTIKLGSKLPDAEVDALGGTFMEPRYYDELVTGESVTVLKPDGTPLLVYVHEALPVGVCKTAYPALRTAAKSTDNRGQAAGRLDLDYDALKETTSTLRHSPDQVGQVPVGAVGYRPVKKDGTLSNTKYSRSVQSGIIGYFDRYQRIPYCRTTAFNLEQPEKFSAAMPFIRAVDRVFAEYSPERHAAQMEAIKKTHPDFVIHGTVFSTVTVNRNWRTALHKDAGDYAPGMGCMAVLEAGRYEGAHLVFPAYRVAVDMRTRGVCLADVHEWHGNTPIVGVAGRYDRVSCVFYYRANMFRCGSPQEELERAKKFGKGSKLWD